MLGRGGTQMIDKAKVLKSCRTFLAGALVLAIPAGAAIAQETAPPVGPPELRDFALPGTRRDPPPAEQPAPTPPPPAQETTPTPTPREQREERAAPPPRRTAPPPRASERPAAAAPEPARPESAPSTPTPEPTPAPMPAPVTSPPAAVTPAAPAPEPSDGGVPWLYLLLAAVAGVVGFAVFRKVRSESAAAEDYVPAPAAQPAPVPPPAPQPAAPVKDTVGVELRPRLELEFKPEKAAATETGASVNYQLSVKNHGKSDARNVRIEVRMFNAGKEQDREIGAFFASEGSGQRIAAPFMLPAQKQAKLERVVAMPREELREIEIQGRRLFIPMVAFNVLYDWGDGRTGQTSMSYIVGREAETPQEKMGAFRLDLGPRVYRSVGQRQTSLARIA